MASKSITSGQAEPHAADVIECRRVWKIFGGQPPSAAELKEWERLSKREIADRFNGIVGVADVSFSVKRGEIFCIMGLSGSGKSTLVRHINRLIDPTSGEVLVNGARVDLMHGAELRKLRNQTIGMVFQHVALLPHRTVRDNVALALELRGSDSRDRSAIADAKLELVQLEGWGNRYPDQLSGGMQQRVGIARALAIEPEVLLMDEPFGALDVQTRDLLQDELLAIWQRERKTVLFVTHSIEEAIYLADRVLVFTPRPARIERVIDIPFGRPRREDMKSDPAFVELRRDIWQSLKQGVRV
jgi:glycine betaine/proline transport system ATP-binding protein